jgi:transposase
MAEVVQCLGWGGQTFAEKVLGWSRPTIRKGLVELKSGQDIVDRFFDRGRKRAEFFYPFLNDHLRLIVEPLGQTDPTFRSTRTYIPLTAASVHQQLIDNFGYKRKGFLCVRTISNKLFNLNYRPMKVAKCRPLKKIPETDDIFDEVHRINDQSDNDDGILRISLDTKAVVNIGAFSRGGKNRLSTKGYDHDFAPTAKLTPFGILLPKTGKSYLWFSNSKVTADFMVDRLEEIWSKFDKEFSPHTLVINADNGPECSGSRTQWLKRLIDFSQDKGITIQLAYYPPYHSKYNPVERLWGVLENHWRGELLVSIEKTLGLARSMTYKSIKPSVRLIKKIYKSGVSIGKKEMLAIEKKLIRKDGLEKWFITISP